MSKAGMGERIFQYVMTEHRSLVVGVFALPLSIVWDAFLYIRLSIFVWLHAGKSLQAKKVERVVAFQTGPGY